MSRKKKKEEKREQLAIKDFFDRILPGVLKFYSDHYICGDSYPIHGRHPPCSRPGLPLDTRPNGNGIEECIAIHSGGTA